MILIHKETLSGTTSSGSLVINTSNLKVGGLMSIVCAKPTTSANIYDIKIVDDGSFTIYERTSETGELAEEVLLPVRGIHTITISNATIDETFNLRLYIREA